MRKPTVHYKSLRKNLRGISGILRGVPDHINQTNMHHLKVQSYLFLCHSAFEVYIENVTKLIIDTSVMNFHRNRKINSCILSLITHETFAQLDEDTPRRSISVNITKNLSSFLEIAKTNHHGIVNSNNGIKLKDQRKLLLPAGLNPEEIDLATANALDAFGTKRGAIAHTFKIQIADTKSSASSEVNNILNGLKSTDDAAVDLLRSHMTV